MAPEGRSVTMCLRAAFAALLITSCLQGAPALALGDGSVRARLEIQSVKVAESKAGQVALDVAWKAYIEQESLRPTEFSIIAILIGARGKEYRTAVTVPVPRSGPVPASSRVTIAHGESSLGPDARVKVTLGAKITDGTSNTFSVASKELDKRLAP